MYFSEAVVIVWFDKVITSLMFRANAAVQSRFRKGIYERRAKNYAVETLPRLPRRRNGGLWYGWWVDELHGNDFSRAAE